MTQPKQCSKCGTVLPPDAPAGVCPKCLLRAGMDEFEEAAGDDATLITNPELNVNRPDESATERGAPQPPRTPPIGTTLRYFGDYELLDEIARGGMGVVYKARQVRLNRIVALKMILAGQFAGPADIQRFHTEAEAAAQLDHPGIVPIFEVGEHEGLHFFSMGLVAGDSLSRRIADGPLAPREAAEIVSSIAEAVQYAHDKGVIHRDLKPANILLDNGSQPRVTDFGLAKKVKADSQLTATGQILGTPSYMPPEQAAGRIDEMQETADIYSLGAILYATLTGHPPFQADNPLDTLMQVLEREPVAPRTLNPKVPVDLETICLKCLEKDRRRRYASAQELADELGRFLNGDTIVARPAGKLKRVVKWSRRRPASAALIGVSVLATVLLAAGGVYFVERLAKERNDALTARNDAVNARNDESLQRGKAEKAAKDEALARAAAVQEQRKADAARTLAEQQRDRAEWLAYSGQLSKVQREWDAGNAQAARDLLASCQWNLRGWEHHYLHTLLNHRGQHTIARHGAAVSGIAISPDGKRLASCGNHNRVKVWDLETGAWMFDVPVGNVNLISNVVFSPDGTRLACSSGNRTALLIDAGTGEIVQSLEGAMGSLVFSPDGRQLATNVKGASTKDPPTIGVWNLESGRLVTNFAGPSGGASSLAFDPAGNRLASANRSGMLQVWDVTDGRELRSIDANRGEPIPVWKKYISSVAFSPDGETIATGSPTGAIRLWNAVDGREVKTLLAEGRRASSLVFSADGRRLAHGEDDLLRKNDNFVRVWDVESGTNLVTFRGHSEGIKAVAFHPDGRRVASAGDDGDIKLWEMDRIHSDILLPAHAEAVTLVVTNGDGTLLATTGWDKMIKLWDVRSPERIELRATIECGQVVDHLALSPDGRLLAGAVRIKHSPVTDELRIWDVETLRPLAAVPSYSVRISALSFSPDGAEIAVGEGKQIRLWEPRTARPIRMFSRPCSELMYSADGRRLASATGQSLHVWNRADWREICSIVPRPHHFVSALAISPDGTRLVSSHNDRTVQVWDVDTGAELHQLRGHVGPVGRLAFSPDGRRIVGGSAQDLHIWEPRQGRLLLTFREDSPFQFDGFWSKSSVGAGNNSAKFLHGMQALVNRLGDGRLRIRAAHRTQAVMPLTSHTQTVNCVVYSPNGLVLATAGDDVKIKLFDTASGIELHTLGGHQGSTRGIANKAIRGIAFNADGSLLASCGVDKTVRLWEVGSGSERRVLTGHTRFPQAVAFRPDGERLVTGDDDARIFVWDVATGEAVTTWKADNRVLCLAYSPDGRRVASSGHDFNVTLWDDATGERVGKLTGHTGLVLEVAFSPDGRWIASSGADSKVMLWNAATGEAAPSSVGNQGYVYGLAFSADSRWLATAGMGKQVHIWDIATNRELVTFHGHPNTVMGVAFHPNGRQLTSVGYGYRDGDAWGPGTVRVWKIPAVDPNKTLKIWPE